MKARRSVGFAALCLLLAPVCAGAAEPPRQFLQGEILPTGQRVTPAAAPGARFESLNPDLPDLPEFRVGEAVALARSPDSRTLLILTSGYNRNFGPDGRLVPQQSGEYVFVYDLGAAIPGKRQVLRVPNTFQGIAWDPAGAAFYVSGGVDDDIHVFRANAEGFAEDGAPIPLGHPAGLGVLTRPMTAGIAVSPDGRYLLVANYQNDSVSLIDLAARAVAAELDLRPGKLDLAASGVAGGEYPVAVAWPSSRKAYVASQRDRELLVLDVAPMDQRKLAVKARIATRGQPIAFAATRAGDRLFVASDNSDTVLVLDTAADAIAAEVPVAAPPALLQGMRGLKGANPNGLALSPDEQTLFVTLGGLNAVAVVRLDAPSTTVRPVAATDDDDFDGDSTPAPAGPRVVGLIPTGWYPTAVALDGEGRRLFVVNGKSSAGPNLGACRDSLAIAGPAACRARNAYVWQLEHAGFLTLPLPSGRALSALTWQAAYNAGFPAARKHQDAAARMAFLRAHIRHVIYVLKENRSYDQVLGDLEVGNGDPRLTLLPEALTPNHHALARQFVTLDNFLDSGESSNTAWIWSTAARTTDFTEKAAPITYAGRGLQYDFEGLNRNLNVSLPASERRDSGSAADPDLLPGPADVAAPDAAGDAPGTAGAGYLWDAALAAHLTLRNYGFYGDFTLYDARNPGAAPLLREPFRERRPVFETTKAALRPVSDPYYRGFDMRLPDFWRLREWQRDFAERVATNAVPNLMLVRLPNDHFGSFADALDGVNTVETQMADNDYAVGALVETVARSPIRDSTLIFIVEDDAQNGADHVDAHRSLLLVAGPYVRHRAVVSTRYTTVSLLRTIEEVLGIPPLGLNDGLADSMADIFDESVADWSYKAAVPPILASTDLPLPKRRAELGTRWACAGAAPKPMAYWQQALGDQDYSVEDRLDTARFNAALWRGRALGETPAETSDGRDLRRGRSALLSDWRASGGCGAVSR